MKKVFEGAAKDSTKPKIYTSYQDVYDDPDVDVVYVGTSRTTGRFLIFRESWDITHIMIRHAALASQRELPLRHSCEQARPV